MEQNFIENELVILTKATIDRFLKEENPADLIALYTFFYYTAKWQKTNIVKATQGYVKKGLGWGIDRLNRSEDKLSELGLIEKINRKDAKGRITGWFVKVNYIFKGESTEIVQNTQKPQVDTATSGKQETNALSTNSLNALSTNIKYNTTIEKEEPATDSVSSKQITLPVNRGKNPLDRLLSIYRDLFKYTYGFDYKVNFGRDKNTLKTILTNYTELQIARLLIVYFNWAGMTGTDVKEKNYLSGATYPLSMFSVNMPKYEAFVRNVLKEDFENDVELYSIIGKEMTAIRK